MELGRYTNLQLQIAMLASVSQKIISEKTSTELDEIIATLVQQENSDSAEMPVATQVAIVKFIMSKKNDDTNDVTISLHEIITALGEIKEKMNLAEHKEALERFEQNGFANLLDSGLAIYRSQTGKKIPLEIVLPPEMESELISYLTSINPQALFGKSESHNSTLNLYYEAFLNFNYVQLRADVKNYQYHTLDLALANPFARKAQYIPLDEKGREYLREQGIGGPNTCKEIIKGFKRISEALAARKKAFEGIKEQLEIVLKTNPTERVRQFLLAADLNLKPSIIKPQFNPKDREVLNYVVDKCLSLEQALKLDKEQIKILSKAAVQKYISNGKLAIEKAITMHYDSLSHLQSKSIQYYIDNDMLDINDLIELEVIVPRISTRPKLADRALQNLDFKEVQKYIGNDKVRLYKIIKLSATQAYKLDRLSSQGKLTDNIIEEVLQSTDESIHASQFIFRSSPPALSGDPSSTNRARLSEQEKTTERELKKDTGSAPGTSGDNVKKSDILNGKEYTASSTLQRHTGIDHSFDAGMDVD